MAFGRTEFAFGVSGADTAERAFKSVAAAEDAAGRAAGLAAAEMAKLDEAGDKASDGVGAFAEVLAKAKDPVKLFGQGVSNIAGMLVSGAVGGLIGGLTAASGAITEMVASMVTGNSQLAEMSRGLTVLTSDSVAAALKVNSIADALDRYARSIGQASAKRLTFAEEQTGMRMAAAGLVTSQEIVRKEAEDIAKQIASLRRERGQIAGSKAIGDINPASPAYGMVQGIDAQIARLEAAADKANRAELGLLGRRGANPMLDAVKDWGTDAIGRAKVLGGQFIDEFRKAADEEARKPKGRAQGEDPFFGPKAMADLDRRAGAFAAARDASERAQRAGMASGVAEFSRPALGEAGNDDAQRQRFDELNAMYDTADSRTRQFFELQNRMISEGKDMLLGFGQGFANAAAAALLSGQGFRKTTNELLKSLAVQALGRSLFEAASAVAMFAVGNVPSAVLHGKAALMFGAIAAGGIGGAMATGGLGGGGAGAGASGGYSGGASASGTNPYQGQGGQSAPVVQVFLGEELVTRGVRTETRREAQRGGMSGHFAMAG